MFLKCGQGTSTEFLKRGCVRSSAIPVVRQLVKGMSSLRELRESGSGFRKTHSKMKYKFLLCYHLPYLVLFLLHLLRTGKLLALGTHTGSGQGEVNFLHRCHIWELWIKPLISHPCSGCCEQCWNSAKAFSFSPSVLPAVGQEWSRSGNGVESGQLTQTNQTLG